MDNNTVGNDARPAASAFSRSTLTRRSFLAGCGGLSAAGLSAQKQSPNVLFIVSDQFHHAAYAAAGNPIVKTPNLDRLAAEGARFTQSLAVTPFCSPTRLLFGRALAALPSGPRPGRNHEPGSRPRLRGDPNSTASALAPLDGRNRRCPCPAYRLIEPRDGVAGDRRSRPRMVPSDGDGVPRLSFSFEFASQPRDTVAGLNPAVGLPNPEKVGPRVLVLESLRVHGC